MVGASSTDIRLNGKVEVVAYGSRALPQQAEKGNSAVAASRNAESAALTLDKNYLTAWKGSKGDYITYTLEDESTISEIGIAWEKNTPKGAAFEIQVSAGGGQFLTVLSDKVKETGQLVNYNLKGKNTASDVRIVLGADKMGVTEVKVDQLRK